MWRVDVRALVMSASPSCRWCWGRLLVSGRWFTSPGAWVHSGRAPGCSTRSKCRDGEDGAGNGDPGAAGARYGHDVLHGRDVELARLVALIEDARDGTAGSVVVHGEPGVGKSALLAEVLSTVSDVRVLRTQGLESESPLAFAALHRSAPTGPRSPRAATGATGARARGRVRAGDGDGRAVPGGGRDPVDAHRGSRGAAGGVCRRRRALARLRLDRRAAVRDQTPGGGPGRDGVRGPRHRRPRRSPPKGCRPCGWTGWTPRRCGRCWPRTRLVVVAAEVTDRLLAETGGNPLALVELPTGLSDAQLGWDCSAALAAAAHRRGRTGLPRPVPSTHRRLRRR